MQQSGSCSGLSVRGQVDKDVALSATKAGSQYVCTTGVYAGGADSHTMGRLGTCCTELGLRVGPYQEKLRHGNSLQN